MNKVILIYGPTAVGKSSIAIELAKMIDGEIISADSMQIYKHLDIGSAKVTFDEMQGIKHHLLSIKEPNEEYSVSDFCNDANKIIDEVLSRQKTPIIVGGTGLYIKSLIEGYDFGDTVRDDKAVKELEQLSIKDLYDRILKIDPNANLDCSNKRRLIRKLQLLQNGVFEHNNNGFKYPYVLFCLIDDRKKIYDRINKRVDNMIGSGLLDEAKYLFDLNIPNSLAMKAIGYKELKPYFDGTSTLLECKETLKQKTRNYAKRQFTFINQFKDAIIVQYKEINDTAKEMMTYLE